MYTLVRRYVKTAVAFLLIGLAIGTWLIARRELAGAAPDPYLVSAHTHALFVGFVMMMIMGVALWLFPRPEKTDVRYDPRLASTAYWLITVGTFVRVSGEVLRSSLFGLNSSALWLRVAIVVAGFLQAIALGVFFFTMWSRIRPVGSQAREAK
ncbi:MAG: cbb3-type cytochrome c oxidase subunit I, partial [Gemmatimonadaceae bacterium]